MEQRSDFNTALTKLKIFFLGIMMLDMNMKMPALMSHLKTVNERIQAYQPGGRVKFDDFLNWVCHDVMDKIMQCSEAKDHYGSVRFYFDKLKEDTLYTSTIASAFSLINNLADDLCTKENFEIAQAHSGPSGKFLNRFKLLDRGTLTLEEFARACREEKNYQKLGVPGGILSVEDIASDYSNRTVLRQYQSAADFFALLFAALSKREGKKIAEIHKKMEELDKILDNLENLLITTPTRLHFRAYWWLYNVYESSQPGSYHKRGLPLDEHHREDIKEWTRTIIEDLGLLEATTEASQKKVFSIKAGNILYEIRYEGQKIFLNNIFMAKTEFESIPDKVFLYFYEHPNKRITKAKLEETLKVRLQGRLPKIMNDLGFVGQLKEVFFPGISSQGGIFMNPITSDYASEKGMAPITFERKQSEIKGKGLKKLIEDTVKKMPPRPAVWG